MNKSQILEFYCTFTKRLNFSCFWLYLHIKAAVLKLFLFVAISV